MSRKPASTKKNTKKAPTNEPKNIEAVLESVLFSSHNPISPAKIRSFIDLNKRECDEIIEKLNGVYEKSGRSFRIYFIAGGYQMRTLPEFNSWIKLSEGVKLKKFSAAAMETLSIIAYRQPVTRAVIDGIRTVDSGYSLKSLLDKGLIRIIGRDKTLPGTPILYGTSAYFLEVFGLNNLQDLPKPADLDLPSDEEIGVDFMSNDTEVGEVNESEIEVKEVVEVPPIVSANG